MTTLKGTTKRGGRGRLLKRALLGRPVSTHAEMHHRLSKRIGLAVFSSDALSSSAYATDEILLALMLAGSAAISLSVPIGIAVLVVLGVVITSYRQTVRAYPGGGGAFTVSRENLGTGPGLIAAAALMVDYVLTVSVSAAAGVAAIGAFSPFVRDNRTVVALALVAIITVMNLRGLKESGNIFAIPTYGFLLAIGFMIIYGGFRFLFGNPEVIEVHHFEAAQDLTVFLVLRAFASGTTALTGVEAISNGVPAFRPPEAKNASQSLAILGFLLAFLFMGITLLGHAVHVDPHMIEEGKTVTSQIAAVVFGGESFFYYVVQVFTALILVLAANTAFADFPRLAGILSREKFLPRIFQSRGDRLAFSNGIVFLSLAAVGVLVRYQADIHKIIPLYVVGVFTTFTLSQTGMVVRSWKRRARAWKRTALINIFGASTTFVVLIVIASTKFMLGAWQVIALIPVVAYFFWRVHGHQLDVEKALGVHLADATDLKSQYRIRANKAVVLVSPFAGGTLRAYGYARSIGPRELHAVAFRVPEKRMRDVRKRWGALGVETQIEATGHRFADLAEYIKGLEPSDNAPVTVVVADPQYPNWIEQVRKNLLLLRIKRRLMYLDGVIVTSVPFSPEYEPPVEKVKLPARLALMVVISRLDLTTIRAIEYARSLHPAELTAMMICTEPGESDQLARKWEQFGIDIPLEIVDSPYREIVNPIVREVRDRSPNPDDVVGVVVPEFVASGLWQHLLHNEPQTAFLIKAALLFEPNVTVIDMPYRLDRSQVKATAAATVAP